MQLPAQTDGTTASNPASSVDLLGAFSIIADELAQVRVLIERELSDCSEPVRGLSAYVIFSKGKMIRPGLVLLSGLACGEITEEHIRVAAIVEMLHNATLLHDDVVDEGKSRRGAPTFNSLKGNESAVLLGDFVLSKVFKMCAKLNSRVAQVIASSAAKMCEGELRQTSQRGNWQLSESEYIEIIADKSAAMFSGACAAGAILAGAGQQQVQMLADYGLNTGIAFQITDDLLDLVGDETKTGKQLGSDLDRNKLTLPLIHLLMMACETDKQFARQVLSQQTVKAGNNDWSKLVEKLRAGGSIEYAGKRAKGFVERAIGTLAELGENAGQRALIETARFVVKRTA